MPQKIYIDSQSNIVIEKFTQAPLAPDQLRIQTEWASGKIGTEMALYKGSVFGTSKFDAEQRIFVEKKPEEKGLGFDFPLGTTGIGTIIEVGKDLQAEWKEGERIIGLMQIAEQNLCTGTQIWPLDDLSPEAGLCFEAAYVAFHAVREGGVQIGDDVAVFGLGALGLLAVQLAKISGAHRVFAIDPIAKRRNLALENGADYVLNPQESTAQQIHDLTQGNGVDVSVELSGSYQALSSAITSTRNCGTVSCAGFYQGEASALWLGREFHHNRLNMVVPHGCGFGHTPRAYPRWHEHRTYDVLIRMLKARQFVPKGIINPVYTSLEEVKELFLKGPTKEFIKYSVKFNK